MPVLRRRGAHRSAHPVARPCVWRGKRTAPGAGEAKRFFTVTHPFHPWRGRRFELIDCGHRWGQWRVFYATAEGLPAYLPASWTDMGPQDPFVQQSEGRAIARVEDLLELVRVVSAAVKQITP